MAPISCLHFTCGYWIYIANIEMTLEIDVSLCLLVCVYGREIIGN